jgi:hypothetical protein
MFESDVGVKSAKPLVAEMGPLRLSWPAVAVADVI